MIKYKLKKDQKRVIEKVLILAETENSGIIEHTKNILNLIISEGTYTEQQSELLNILSQWYNANK